MISLRCKLTSLTLVKSNTIPVGRRNLKYFVILLPISSFGCLLSLLADQASIRLLPAATILISLFIIIPLDGIEYVCVYLCTMDV